jgi:predicted nucleic acid-binding protein
MRVLLDTDVVLDLILTRKPFADDAAAIWTSNERGEVDACISPITPVNVFYIVRRLKGTETARQAVNELLAGLRVCALDQDDMRRAAALPMRDYEDSVQVAAATADAADAIITRNIADYGGAPVPVLTPGEFAASLPSPEQTDPSP